MRTALIAIPILGGLLTPLLAEQKPNIIYIIADDLGYGDLTCYGNTKIKTPHLDRLAKEGQRWTSFYSSGSTCVPSRTGLMSGRHPALIGKQKLSDAPEKLAYFGDFKSEFVQ